MSIACEVGKRCTSSLEMLTENTMSNNAFRAKVFIGQWEYSQGLFLVMSHWEYFQGLLLVIGHVDEDE